MKADPYALLGIDEAAMPSEVEKAYRKKSLRVHPDKVQTGTSRRRSAGEPRRLSTNLYASRSAARRSHPWSDRRDPPELSRGRSPVEYGGNARPSHSAWDEDEQDDEPDSQTWKGRTYGTSSTRFPTWASSSSSGTRPSSFLTGTSFGTSASRARPPLQPRGPHQPNRKQLRVLPCSQRGHLLGGIGTASLVIT